MSAPPFPSRHELQSLKFWLSGMRIAVVGTSNSLRRDGYTSYLVRDPRVTALSNFSIGASTGLHSLRSTEGIDFRRFDFCLIDFSVNEEVVRKNNALNLDVSKSVAENLIVRCLSGGCIPVITLLPRMIETHQSRMRQFYLKIAAGWGVPFFDGFELVDFIKEVSDIRGSGLFMDVAHIRPWVCLVFARALADGLASLPAERTGDRTLFAPALATVKVADRLASADGLEIVERGSSRASGHFVKASRPTRVALRDVVGESLIGLCVNLSETNCIASFRSMNSTALDLRNHYFGNASFRIVISALPLMETISIAEGTLEIETLDEAAASALGGVGGMEGELGRSSQPAGGQLEIADIFLRLHGEVRSQHAPVDGLHRPLLLPSAKPALEVAAGVYRSLFSKEHDDAEERASRVRAREKRRMKIRAAART